MMNLKRLFFGFLLLVANIGLAQQSMEFTLKYNSGLNRYEVYCLPNFTQNNFTWGPSQISVVVPASVANTPLPNLTPVAGGGWNDNSLIYAPSIQPQNDFHGVGSLGALTNLVANQELLIFHFTLPGGCVAGVRLFINGVDPDSSQPGMGFGDFGNSIDNGNITDIYASNYDNTGSNCIDAVSDSFSATIAGGIVGNILWNDLLGGVIILPNPSDVVITASVVPGNPIQINTVTGEVFVSPGTPAGTYTLPYTICEATTTGQNLNNCDTATVTVVVGASPIIANYDFYYASNGTTGAPNLGNAYLENDSLNGAPVIVSQIDGSIITGATPAFLGANVPVLDTLTGIVSVPANTPGGTYYIYYQICEVLNLANCDQDSIEIKVDPPVIDAVIDIAGPVLAGQNGIINVLTNDTLNTLPILPGQASDVTVTTLPNSDPELTLNPDGSIDVDPGTPPGLYVLYYQVCEVLNPGNCDDDSVLVTVVSSPIIANADIYGPIDGTNGSPNFGNIFANDSLNGAPVVPGDLTLDPNWNSLSTSPLQVYINPNGTITVEPGTPAGSYIVVYQICETAAIPANSNCDTALVTIVVVPAPEIVNISTPEDTPITICTDTLANLLDPIVSVLPCGAGGPSNGTFVPNPSEGPTCYTYTPNWNFNGTDQACLVSCTASGVCDTTFINIIVTPVNDAPTTNDINVVTSINTPIGVNVGAGTSDPENNPLTYSFGPATNGGTFTVDGNGTITVTPPTGFTGTITIPFTVCDESIYPVTVLCDQGVITVTVIDTTGGINNAPVANTDQATTPIDTPVIINPLANDFDVDGDDLTITSIDTPTSGAPVPTINPDGTINYTPPTGFTGIDTIVYQVCDNGSPVLCDIDTIFIYVVPVVDEPNVAPIATDDYVSTPEDVNVIIGVLDNDSDPNGDELGDPTIIDGPNHGDLVDNGDGTFTYDPDPNYNGPDTITYVICDTGNPVLCDTAIVVINVTPVNDAPTTTNVDVVTTINTPVGVNVGAGTSDPENNPLTYEYQIPSTVLNGTYTIDGNGTITVIPDLDYVGDITITFEVCDSSQFQVTSLCDQGTITVTVIDPSSGNNNPPLANNDFATVPVNTPQVIVNPLGNDFDADGDNLTVTPTDLPTSGGVQVGTVLPQSNGTFIYYPPAGFVGTVTIPYEICDGGIPNLCDNAVITIVISPVVDEPNVAPIATDDYATTPEDTDVIIAVMQNDSDPNGNSISFSGIITPPNNGIATPIVGGTPGLVNYNPNPGFVGLDSFEYVICDNGNSSLCDTAMVYINVLPFNEPPVAVDDDYTTNEDTPLVLNPNPTSPLSNDTDPDGDVLTITSIDNEPIVPGTPISIDVPNGTVDVQADGTITFNPELDFVGESTFPYTVCDNIGLPEQECVTADITITVLPVTDTTDLSTEEDTPITVCTDTLTNFGSSPAVSISICEQPTNGTLSPGAGTTCLVYEPTQGFVGTDSFCVITCAANGFCDTTIFEITVTPLNDEPLAVNDSYETNEDTDLVLIPVPAGNDTDPDAGDVLSVTILNGVPVTPGIALVNPIDVGDGEVDYDGTNFTFSPDPEFVGVVSFPYTVCDNSLVPECDDAIITITVLPVTDTINVSTPEDTPFTVCLDTLTNFGSSPAVSISICEQPTNGTLSPGAGTTCLIYEPIPGFVGTDSFCVITCAANGFCDTTIFEITVTPENDEPVAVDDNYTTLEDTPLVLNPNPINPLSNDTDPDGDVLTITSIDNEPLIPGTPIDVPNGTIDLAIDGTITFTPDIDFVGESTFPYTVCDNGTPQECDSAIITITVLPVTDTTNVTVDEGVPTTLCTSSLTNFGSSPDVSISFCEYPSNGVIGFAAGTTCFTYTPNGVENDTICVITCAANGYCDTTIFVITVDSLPDVIDAIDDVTTTDSDTPVDIDVLDNDTTPNPLTCFNIVTQPTAGDVTINADSTITYTPDETGCGTDSFTYVICDAVSSDTATVVINLNDVTPPTFANCPADTIVVDAFVNTCWAQVYWPTPVVQDNCGGNNVFVTSNFPNGNVFPVGNHNVILVATDAAGNSDTCEFVVSVVDPQAPVFNLCPVDLNLENDPGVCGAIATWIEPTVFDNCGYTVTVSSFPTLNLGIDSLFPVGTTTMTYIVVDQSGLSDTCTFNVIVTDTEAPVITNVPSDIVVYATAANCDIQVTWTEPTVSDNCGILSSSVSPPNGSVFSVGEHVVTYDVEDINGNDTIFSFTVTVLDTIAPVMVSCPSDITISSDPGVCGAIAAWPLPVATDNCDNTLTYTVTSGYQLGDLLPVGDTIVTYSITDDSGNEVICSFTVTVEDNEAPVITGLPTAPVNGCANTPTTWSEPTITDNCGVDQVNITSTTIPNPQSGSVFPIGTTTVTYEAIDINGNATTYSFDVVINSSTTVSISGSSKIELCLGESATLSVENPSSSLNYTWSLFNTVVGTGSSYAINGVSADDEGDYTVQVTDANGCSASDLVEVVVDNCGIRIPEAFTPNGNGQNEVFYIDNLESYPNTEVIIFNRWGSMVYKSDDYKNDWAGVSINKLNIAGDQLPEGTYFYIIKLGGKETDATFGKIYKGYVYIKK